MGCVASKVDKDERVRICEDRKRLMKELMHHRKEFAVSQLAYLRSLKNTGATLRQFTESECLEAEETASGTGFAPSPPPSLPPSPPPPPSFSPDSRKSVERAPQAKSETMDTDKESDQILPPPHPSSSWEYWDLFASSSEDVKHGENEEAKENWADTNSEFAEDDEKRGKEIMEEDKEGGVFTSDQVNLLLDDNSSTSSDNEDAALVAWRGRKSVAAIVKDLDEYFLKASATLKDVAVLIDVDMSGSFSQESVKEQKRKGSNSAKVFSALSWSWSSRSLQSSREMLDFSGEFEPCKPGAHCITLQKLYTEEQKLYKNIKEEEATRMEYIRKTALLQRQEEEHDSTKSEKTRQALEFLEARILSVQESIEQSCSNIVMLINEELQPQLIALASGMMHMWRTMHKCHKFQNNISQQLNRLTEESSVGPTTEYLLLAACQLREEVSSWCNSFNSLTKFQREYVRALFEWSKLTESLHQIDGQPRKGSSMVHELMQKWQLALDKLPEKMVAEAIGSLLLAISRIFTQLQDEQTICRRCGKLARRLEREMALLSEVETKFGGIFPVDSSTTPNGKHPLVTRRAKVEALKRSVDDENDKYTSSVKVTRAMILNNLKTRLPRAFQALTTYSGVYVQSFEDLLYDAKREDA